MSGNRLRVAEKDDGRLAVEAGELAAAERAEAQRRSREVVLVVLLTTFLAGAAVAVLVFVTMGFFLLVAAVALGFFLLGSVHYLLWGRWVKRVPEKDE